MITSDYNKEMGETRNVLNNLKEQLLHHFPDLAIAEILMDKVIVFGKTFAATIYAINPPRDEFDIVIKTEDTSPAEPTEETDLTTDDVVMMLQPYYENDYSQEVTPDDVDDVMKELIQRNPSEKEMYKQSLKERLLSRPKSVINENITSRWKVLAGLVRDTPAFAFVPPKPMGKVGNQLTEVQMKLKKLLSESLPAGFNLKGGKYSHILRHLKQQYGYNSPKVYQTAWKIYNAMRGVSEDANLIHDPELMNEYLPPKFRENHERLLNSLKKTFGNDKVGMIKKAWEIYGELPSANAKLRENELVDEEPNMNNHFHGRNAQLAGCLGTADGSDYSELDEEESMSGTHEQPPKANGNTIYSKSSGDSPNTFYTKTSTKTQTGDKDYNDNDGEVPIQIREREKHRDQTGRKKWSRSEIEDPFGTQEIERQTRNHHNKEQERTLGEGMIIDPSILINSIRNIFNK